MRTGRVPLLAPPQTCWECPDCDLTDVTRQYGPHTRYHPCRGLRGLSAPMVPAGTKAKITAHEREDYIGGDVVQTDGEGRPVMAVVTTRDDGTDVTVLAPCATARSDT